jgi:hypothetical protein
MGHTPILFPRTASPLEAPGAAWLLRAAQARRIALMLAGRDAEIVEAYALECEAKAAQPVKQKRPAIAA